MVNLNSLIARLKQNDLTFSDEELGLVPNFRRIILANRRFDIILASVKQEQTEEGKFRKLISWVALCATTYNSVIEDFINAIEQDLGSEVFSRLMSYDDAYFLTAEAFREEQREALGTLLLDKIGKSNNRELVAQLLAADKRKDFRSSGLPVALQNGDITFAAKMVEVVRIIGGNSAVVDLLKSYNGMFTSAIMDEQGFRFLIDTAKAAGGMQLVKELALVQPVKFNTFYYQRQMEGARRVKAFLAEVADPEFTVKFKNLIRLGRFEFIIAFAAKLKIPTGAIEKYLNSVDLSREAAWLTLLDNNQIEEKMLPRMAIEDWRLFINDFKSFSPETRKRLLAEDNYFIISILISRGIDSIFDEIRNFVDQDFLKDMVVANRNKIFLDLAAEGNRESMAAFIRLVREVRGDSQMINMLRWSGNASVYTASRAGNEDALEVLLECGRELGGQILLDELQGNLYVAPVAHNQNSVAPDDMAAIIGQSAKAPFVMHTSKGNTGSIYTGEPVTNWYYPASQEYYLKNPWQISGETIMANQAAWMRHTGKVAPHIQLTNARPKYFDLEIYEYSREILRELVELTWHGVDLENEEFSGVLNNLGFLLPSIENYAFKIAETFTTTVQVDTHILEMLESGFICNEHHLGYLVQGWLLLPPKHVEGSFAKPEAKWNKEEWAAMLTEYGYEVGKYFPSAGVIAQLCKKNNCRMPTTPQEMLTFFYWHQAEQLGVCLLPGTLESILTPGTPSFELISGLTFGVETAYFGVDEKETFLRQLTAEVQEKWRIDYDRGIRIQNIYGGTQSASPIIDNSNLEQFERAIELPKLCGAWVNSSGAVHVHIGIKNNFEETAGLEFAKQFSINYMLMEKELSFLDHRLMHNYNDIFRVNGLEMFNVIKNILGANSMDEIQYAIRPDAYTEISPLRLTRQRAKVNLNAYAEHGTIEVRHHPASVEPAEIMAWLKFLDRFAAITKDMCENGAICPQQDDIQRLREAVAEYKNDRRHLNIIDDIELPPERRAMKSDRSTRQVDHTARYLLS